MIYVTGDMHGEHGRITSSKIKRLKKNDTLIVLGDFGFVWDGGEKEKKFLEYLGKRRYNVCFIDGTHENFDLLYQYPETIWNGGRVRRISGHCFYLCRGQVFEIEGKRIFTFGGGESADRDLRLDQEHISWWRQELPTAAELEEGAHNVDELGCELDIVLTHEPPSRIKSSLYMRLHRNERISKLNGYFEELNSCVEFKKWYFGSCHEDKVITPRHTAVFKDVIALDEKELRAGK